MFVTTEKRTYGALAQCSFTLVKDRFFKPVFFLNMELLSSSSLSVITKILLNVISAVELAVDFEVSVLN